MSCNLPGPSLIAYLADDPDVAAAARAVLETAELVAVAFTGEGLDRLSEALDTLAKTVEDSGLRPEHVPAASAALVAHVHRTDQTVRAARTAR